MSTFLHETESAQNSKKGVIMVDQTKITGYAVERLGQQIANAQTAAECNDALKDAVNSDQAEHLQEIADKDRINDKMTCVENNEQLQDRIHISEQAMALHKAHEVHQNQSASAPERAHDRMQSNDIPEPPGGSLGNME